MRAKLIRLPYVHPCWLMPWGVGFPFEREDAEDRERLRVMKRKYQRLYRARKKAAK